MGSVSELSGLAQRVRGGDRAAEARLRELLRPQLARMARYARRGWQTPLNGALGGAQAAGTTAASDDVAWPQQIAVQLSDRLVARLSGDAEPVAGIEDTLRAVAATVQ